MKRLQTPLLMPLLGNPKIKDFLISYVKSPYMTKIIVHLFQEAAHAFSKSL